MSSIIIYSKNYTERQAYVFDFVFRQVFGLDYIMIHSQSEFESSALFRINYSAEDRQADLQLVPHSLLFENDIRSQEIIIGKWHEHPVFFQSENSDIPFDIFAATFYLISRYEEYLPFTPDLYQRFPHSDSLAFKNNFLHIPIVDSWLKAFRNVLQAKSQSLVFKRNNFRFLPTYDIDIAYSYIGKGAGRNLGGALNDLIKGDISLLKERRSVLSNEQKDPYDSYDFLDAIHQQYKLEPIYFFLAGKNGKLDKNIPFDHPVMKKLFADISSKYAVGIHPSYQSHDSIEVLRSEIAKIQTNKSRQHYIRFTLPATYRNLLSAGITEDYSMGYGSINGFRAGTSFSFFWFDLSKNEITKLQIFPFCFMECNSFFEQHFTAKQASTEMKHYVYEVKNVDGTLITIWHNFSLGSDPLWKGWKQVYEEFLTLI